MILCFGCDIKKIHFPLACLQPNSRLELTDFSTKTYVVGSQKTDGLENVHNFTLGGSVVECLTQNRRAVGSLRRSLASLRSVLEQDTFILA